MLITRKEKFAVEKPVFSSLLVLLFTLSFVNAQQTARRLGDPQPPANLTSEPDDRQNAKLAVYQVHRLAEKILALNDVRVKALEVARLAAVLWENDETHARFLFEKALNLTIPNGNQPDARALSTVHRRVIALIARSDAEWAKRLIDAAAKREGDQGSKTFSSANIRTALGLLEEDPTVAVEFAERSLKGGVNSAFLDFVLTLRKKDEPAANRLFLQALNYFSQQPAVNIEELHSLGLYLFTAPDVIDPDARMLTRVEDMIVPNIAADRPGVPPTLTRAYLATAADVLWRMSSDAQQRKNCYALCYMLLPKSRNMAPDLTAKFNAVMEALTPQVPTGLTSDSAYRYINAAPTTADEKLNAAENQPDQESRDMAYLEIALQAWRKGEFKTCRIAQRRISDLEASQRLATIIDFGEGAWTIKHNAADFTKAEAMANRLPQGIERSILLQGIAKIQGNRTNPDLAEETVNNALKAARSMSEGRRSFLLLTAAAQLASLKSPAVHAAMAEVIRDFNSFEEPSLSGLDWAQVVQVGPMRARFPLEVADIDFSFTEAFRAVALYDPEAAMARAEELRHENLRAQSLVEVGRAFLEKLPAEPIQNEPIRVGEDGMRKSAAKTVMPSYPDEALKKREQGVVVVEVQYDPKGDVINASIIEAPSKSIGDAVVIAVKQWKFVPSKKQDGTPVSIRGKLTFYFDIDKEGKGRVQNPKQYR
jgi:TonB family protein